MPEEPVAESRKTLVGCYITFSLLALIVAVLRSGLDCSMVAGVGHVRELFYAFMNVAEGPSVAYM